MSEAFILATGADTAGTSVRLAQAFKRQGGKWSAHSMATSTNYIDYPIDLRYTAEGLLRRYDDADLVMLNSTMHGHRYFDRGQGKPTVLMHHGFHTGHFARDVHGCVAEAVEIGATQVGSTANLELLGPVAWLPTAYDLPGLARMRRKLYRPHPLGRIRIGHAPTDRKIKSTEAVIAAVKSLQERGLPVDLVLIEGRTWAETMKLKARYVDVLVDQLALGYGCNAVEAWAFGIPVVGAVNEHPDWRAHMVKRFGLKESPTGLPMVETDEALLAGTLDGLIRSKDMRDEWTAIGTAHAQRWHSEPAVTAIASGIWDTAVRRPTKPSVPIKLFPPVFRRRQHPRIKAPRRSRTPLLMRR